MPDGEGSEQFTPEQDLNMKKRTLNDARLLQHGARYENGVLTGQYSDQIPEARSEMDSELFDRKFEERGKKLSNPELNDFLAKLESPISEENEKFVKDFIGIRLGEYTYDAGWLQSELELHPSFTRLVINEALHPSVFVVGTEVKHPAVYDTRTPKRTERSYSSYLVKGWVIIKDAAADQGSVIVEHKGDKKTARVTLWNLAAMNPELLVA